ncbi:prepilin-type N-terminal cleavage/methylation domain-containing protein [bacterium]|nr:MAG: prepilin-type N-terminal cleavage/methylation domain-containing protein [bacterium]
MRQKQRFFSGQTLPPIECFICDSSHGLLCGDGSGGPKYFCRERTALCSSLPIKSWFPMIKSRLSARGRRGFTLVELLVVVLILAILMAVALPLYVSSVNDASKKTCRANMQSIANAAQAWKVKTRAADFSALAGDITLLNDDLGTTPKTPNNGDYSIAVTGTIIPEAGGTGIAIPTGSFGVKSGATDPGECNGFIPGVMTR